MIKKLLQSNAVWVEQEEKEKNRTFAFQLKIECLKCQKIDVKLIASETYPI